LWQRGNKNLATWILSRPEDPDGVGGVQLADEIFCAKFDNFLKLDHVTGNQDLLNVVLFNNGFTSCKNNTTKQNQLTINLKGKLYTRGLSQLLV
jgi:hypothetical protein